MLSFQVIKGLKALEVVPSLLGSGGFTRWTSTPVSRVDLHHFDPCINSQLASRIQL